MSLVLTILRILAIFLASFVFWRKLKEDYPNEEIFSLIILIFSFGILGGWKFFLQGAFLGTILPLILFSKLKKWDFWLAADALVFPLLIVGFVFFLPDLPKLLLIFIVGFLTLKIKKTYRSLSWYKSGKVGFLACFSVIAFFGPFLLLDFFGNKPLYLILADFLIIVGAAFLLYRRAERDFKQDMASRIKFPQNILKPIKEFLHLEEKKLEKRKESLEESDPFSDTRRLTDNASPDADASEQFGHATIEALKKEVERKLIQVRKALARIKIGRYGLCEECHKMIDTDRLMIIPEATVCAQCERKKK